MKRNVAQQPELKRPLSKGNLLHKPKANVVGVGAKVDEERNVLGGEQSRLRLWVRRQEPVNGVARTLRLPPW